MRRAAGPEWPRILNPAPGCYPPAAEHRATERVLHISMWPGLVGQLYLHTISTAHRMVFWPGKSPDAIAREACCAAREIRPTVVFMQLQTDGVLEPRHVSAIRACCDPSVVICNWDGDQHYEPGSPQREWFVRLGQVCDASLVVNTEHQETYARLGVRHPGFFEIAVDPTIFRPVPPADGVPPVVLLANGISQVHAGRMDHVHYLDRELGPQRFAVYGGGWETMGSGRCSLDLHQESPVYAAALASLSASARNDLPRYTSDRLFRLLASGGVPVVERFPDCEGLGLVDGKNCLLWSGVDGLMANIHAALDMTEPVRRSMRQGAAELGLEHTWPSRLPEFLALIDAVRNTGAVSVLPEIVSSPEPPRVPRGRSCYWPRLLTPLPGAFLPVASHRRTERLLHISLRNSYEKNPGLRSALEGISAAYEDVEWTATPKGQLVDRLLEAAGRISPTVVFAQSQGAPELTADAVHRLRQECAPGAVIIQWDGDMHYGPGTPQRQWFVDLGTACDASLTTETAHQEAYARLGVVRPGYLAVAVDGDIYKPSPPVSGVPEVVMLASESGITYGYTTRRNAIEMLSEWLGPERFRVYGFGRPGTPCGGRMLMQPDEAPVYAAAKAAISISITAKLPRYTSDRLMRMLCSGAVCVVEAFPDCNALGLIHGENCLLWTNFHGLRQCIDYALNEDCGDLRTAGAQLGKTLHTWEPRMLELLALVDSVREARQ